MSTALVHAGLTSLEKIENINPRELEMVERLKHLVRILCIVATSMNTFK